MILVDGMVGGITWFRIGQDCGDGAAVRKSHLLHWVLLAVADVVRLLLVAWHPERVIEGPSTKLLRLLPDRAWDSLKHDV